MTNVHTSFRIIFQYEKFKQLVQKIPIIGIYRLLKKSTKTHLKFVVDKEELIYR